MGRQRHTAFRAYAAAAAFLVAALQAGCERAPRTNEAGLQGTQAPDAAEQAANGAIASAPGDAEPAFDLVLTEVRREGENLVFVERVSGRAGESVPTPVGQMAGARVFSYVWPVSVDPSAVGFEGGTGTLALAATAHPDFDDTPLFDENNDGILDNDGASWHSHWVVLGEDTACAGGLKVRDISPGQDALPATAPMLPLALDSPGMSPILEGSRVRLTVPVRGAEGVAFDAVTAELQVHPEEDGTPFLCVVGVHKTASGNLSYPGRITREQR